MATDPQSLLSSSNCYMCYGVSQADAMSLALLAQISNNTATPASGDVTAKVLSDVAYTSNATPANVTDLTLNVVAGSTYHIEAYILINFTTGGTGGGVKLNFGGGTATATTFSVVSSTLQGNTVNSNALATNMSFAPGGALLIGAFFSGVFQPSASGTLILKASQNTSGTNTTTIKAGSLIVLEKL